MHRSVQYGLAVATLLLASMLPADAFAASAGTSTPGADPWSFILVVLVLVVVALLVAVGILLLHTWGDRQQGAGAAPPALTPAESAEELPDALEVQSVSAPMNTGKRNAATAAIVVVVVIAAAIVAGQTTRPKVTEDAIVRTFSTGDPCVTAVIPLAVDSSADAQKTADAVFSALTPIRSLTTGTYDIKSATLEIGFCESETSEAAIREALAATGLLGEDTTVNEVSP